MKPLLGLENNRVKLAFPGDILSTNVETLREQIFSTLNSTQYTNLACDAFEFDFTKAQMIDSAGLNLVVSVLRQVKKKATRISALVASAHVGRILRFTRLDRQMEIIAFEQSVPA